MSARSIASDAVTSFENWVNRTLDDEFDGYKCLSDYIFDWVTSTDGIAACQGDYRTYVVAVVALISAWHEGQLSLGVYKSGESTTKRSVTKIFTRELYFDGVGELLDSQWFAKWTFATLHPDLPHGL